MRSAMTRCFGRSGCDGPAADSASGKLGVIGLASLVFYAVSGTPAGTEDTIVAAGPLLALVGFLVMPIVWAIPESLVTAELSTAFPHNGGYVIWVANAFGPTAGFVEGMLKFLSGILDNCAYPVMMLNYFRQLPNSALASDDTGRVFVAGVTVALSGAQWLGLEIVGTASAVVLAVTMIPFVILVFGGIGTVKWSRLGGRRLEGDIDWALYLQTLFWNLNYWDAVSTLASEVENPSRTFPRALLLAGVATVSMYLLVLGVAIGNTPDGVEWDNSQLADAGLYVGGPWLQIWIVVSVAISASGLFLADLSTGIFMLDGMAQLGMLPKVLSWKNRNGVPIVAFFVQVTFVFAFIQMVQRLEDIVSYSMVSYCFSQLLEFVAFVRLRQVCPAVKRPFRVPGGLREAAVLVTPALMFTVAVMCFSEWDVWVAALAQVVVSVALAVLCRWQRQSRPHLFVVDVTTSSADLGGDFNDDDGGADDELLIEADVLGRGEDGDDDPCRVPDAYGELVEADVNGYMEVTPDSDNARLDHEVTDGPGLANHTSVDDST